MIKKHLEAEDRRTLRTNVFFNFQRLHIYLECIQQILKIIFKLQLTVHHFLKTKSLPLIFKTKNISM